METKSQAFGKPVARRRFMLPAAITCGVLTGICIVGRAAEDPSAAAVQRGLAFLAGRQHDDGSYGADVYQGHVAVTAFVSRAMMASGSKPGEGPYGERLSKSLAYLLGRVQESGLISSKDANEPAPMYGHAFALMFLAECQKAAPKDEIKVKIDCAVKLIVKSQNKEGGWRYLPKPGDADLSVTVTQLMALAAARDAGVDVPKDVIDRAIDYVKKSQNRDGGFRYLLQGGTSGFARSAAAVTALNHAGTGDCDEVRKGSDYIAKFPAGETIGQPEVFYFYGHYYAAQVMCHADKADWDRWSAAVRDRLLEQQGKDGSWPDAASVDLGTAMACLTLQTKPEKP
ncbi:MAG: prenyltransferase/squalene oxidase repeat-containing protein [Thermoguttaceae bacterium]